MNPQWTVSDWSVLRPPGSRAWLFSNLWVKYPFRPVDEPAGRSGCVGPIRYHDRLVMVAGHSRSRPNGTRARRTGRPGAGRCTSESRLWAPRRYPPHPTSLALRFPVGTYCGGAPNPASGGLRITLCRAAHPAGPAFAVNIRVTVRARPEPLQNPVVSPRTGRALMAISGFRPTARERAGREQTVSRPVDAPAPRLPSGWADRWAGSLLTPPPTGRRAPRRSLAARLRDCAAPPSQTRAGDE